MRGKPKFNPVRVFLIVVPLAIMLFWTLGPIYWILVTAFTTNDKLYSPVLNLFPDPITLSQFNRHPRAGSHNGPSHHAKPSANFSILASVGTSCPKRGSSDSSEPTVGKRILGCCLEAPKAARLVATNRIVELRRVDLVIHKGNAVFVCTLGANSPRVKGKP